MPAIIDPLSPRTRVLELGPGFGATTEVLAERFADLTALEVDEASAERLRGQFASRAEIVHGDGAGMPFAEDEFGGVVCFTMLHHVPSPAAQDELFAEAFRVLRPGGIFTGMDGLPNPVFNLLHIGDTLVPIDPKGLPERLAAVGFTGVLVGYRQNLDLWFSARKPD